MTRIIQRSNPYHTKLEIYDNLFLNVTVLWQWSSYQLSTKSHSVDQSFSQSVTLWQSI